ncbi:MAG: ISLre2 family transposase [Dehalococcoidia bacterium]|nr:ISLre2 family transposase [Dehalococcoidia bacterium]
MESINELAVKLKGDVREWEGEIYNWACSFAQELAKAVLEGVDKQLMKEKDQSLKVECLKEHRVKTVFGDVRIRRRLYRDSNGETRFLLDEKMGLDKGCHVSPKAKEMAVFTSSYFPFLGSEDLLRAILPSGISHTTIHRLVGKLTDPYIRAEEREIEEVFDGGVIPGSEGRIVPYLFVEADGTSIALQREEARRAEVKVGIAYEGWEEVSKNRYKLKDKTVYTGIMSGDRFWEGFSLALAKKYDLSQIGNAIVGGDGTPWVKEGAKLLGDIYQLDKFHLKRALHRGLANDPLVVEVYQACITGHTEKADRLLVEAQQKADADRQKEIMGLRGYLMANCYGLRDYRLEVGGGDGLRGLGTIEGNVDKLVANRMKKRGMSWTINGARRMARLIRLRESGQLQSWIPRMNGLGDSQPPERKTTSGKTRQKHAGAWLEAGMPALYGPHQNRHWVQILRVLTYRILEI